MKKHSPKLLFVFACVCFQDQAFSQSTNFDPGDFLIIDAKVNSWVDSGYYPGASLIIARDNKIIYEKYYGNYSSHTVAYIASAGKWLAAATIAAVVDEGKLKWNDKVKNWLPQFSDIRGEATLKQLFSHTSGFPAYQPKSRRRDDYQTLKESVENIEDLPADTLPGTEFYYGGLAMQVAGRMAELATGKEWEALFQEKIAGPLKMQHTHFTPVDTTPGFNPMLGGAARACVQDYANFLSMISMNGLFKGKRILSVQSIKEMQADQVGNAVVTDEGHGDYIKRIRSSNRKDIYGLGEWREETNEKGEAVLISSPGWIGTYPWIDKKNNVYGIFLTTANVRHALKNGFYSFYTSAVLAMLVREIINTSVK